MMAAILVAAALLALFTLALWGVARGARRLLGNDAASIGALAGCAACAQKPVCETGALAGWPRHPPGCPNLERLRRRAA
jgi:hypothetical protein